MKDILEAINGFCQDCQEGFAPLEDPQFEELSQEELNEIGLSIGNDFLKVLVKMTGKPNELNIQTLAKTLRTTLQLLTLKLSERWSSTVLDMLTNCFRCIRNACCTVPDIQSHLAADNFLLEPMKDVITVVEQQIGVGQEEQNTHGKEMQQQLISSNQPVLVALRCMVQALANMSVNNEANQLALITSSSLQSLLTDHLFKISDWKCGDYCSMLISTCMSNPKTVSTLISQHQHFFTSCLVKMTCVFKEQESEWVLLCLRRLWNSSFEDPHLDSNSSMITTSKSAFFTPSLYASLEEEQRSLLFEVLLNILKQNDSQNIDATDSHSAKDGLNLNLSQIVNVFNSDAKTLFSSSSNSSCASSSMVQLLEVLCVASASSSLLPTLQVSSSLLMTVTTMLIQIVALEQQQLSQSGDFHRDVVRLLGNLCWKNRHNQDIVRDLNGIAAVLGSFQVNEASPFIRQWAVFALRNLCEDNLENQEVVAGIQLRGTDDCRGILEEMGLEIELDGGKPRLKKRD